MRKILTFEAFVPKNIDKRAEDLKKMQAKDLKEYDEFVKKLSKNLTAIQDKKSVDGKEQLFIDIIKNNIIKNDVKEYPFRIFLLKDDKYMFEYDWKTEFLMCSYNRVWEVFESKFNMSYQEWQQFMTDQIETHFKFKPYTINA